MHRAARAQEQPGINIPISALTLPRRKALVSTLRVGTEFVPLRGAFNVNRRKALVSTLRVGTEFVPLRGALGVNRRRLFPTHTLFGSPGLAATEHLATREFQAPAGQTTERARSRNHQHLPRKLDFPHELRARALAPSRS